MKWGFPFSISFLFWGLMGILRYLNEKTAKKKIRVVYTNPQSYLIAAGRVAVCLPARNEEKVIQITINSVKQIVPLKNLFVVSDGSTDDTAKIARANRANVIENKVAIGKARALEKLIDKFKLFEKFDYILFVDADTKLDKNYLRNALPMFKDRKIAAIAGFAFSEWHTHKYLRWKYYFTSYRYRLYRILQIFLSFGQTWKYTNVLWVIPGFASIYRTSVLKQLKIYVPGLLIEDFNLAFQVRKKKLGIIGHHPSVFATAQDPSNLKDYFNQVKRWNLGFFQTVKHYGIWPSFFWVALGVFTLEVFINATFFLFAPIVLFFLIYPPLLHLLTAKAVVLPHAVLVVNTFFTLGGILSGLLFFDYAMTVLIAVKDKKWPLLLYGLGFIFLRYLDVINLFLTTPKAFFTRSHGVWTSPGRS